MQNTVDNAERGAVKGALRKHVSLENDLTTTIPGDSGFSYFPGYAVDVETGERLNMAFGEDSYIRTAKGFSTEMGHDMIWNPDANDTIPDSTVSAYISFGGKHAVYDFGHVNSTIVQATPSGTSLDTMYM